MSSATVPEGKLSCVFCGKRFSRGHHLARHTAIHTKNERHCCLYCSKTFARSDICRKHANKCPRREAQQQLPAPTRGRRPSACAACYKSKSACDRQTPCHRCLNRRLECSYRKISTTFAISTEQQPGTPFLLKITNPRAKTMLEVFDYDEADPDVDGAAASATIGWGQAVADEDDILLWNLSSVLDLQQLGLSSADDYRIPCPPASMADLAPIFHPAAFNILETKLDFAVSQLCALHKRLRVSSPSYFDDISAELIKAHVSARNVIVFSVVFFQLSHRYISLVHRPSFGSPDTSVALLLAVAFAGAARSPPRKEVLGVHRLARLLEEFIFQSLDQHMLNLQTAGPSRELIETLQAAILIHLIQFMRHLGETRERMRTARLPKLISTSRKLRLFAAKHTHDTDWLQFVETESRIRAAHWIAMSDWYQTVMFHMPPQVAVWEMDGDMPCSLDIWNARTAQDFQAASQTGMVPLHPWSICRCIEGLIMPGGLAGDPGLPSGSWQFSMSDLMLVLFGLTSVAISAELTLAIGETASKWLVALERWQHLWKDASRSLDKISITSSGIERYSYEHAMLLQKIIKIATAEAGPPKPPYLASTGHDTIAALHEFLVQHCQPSAG